MPQNAQNYRERLHRLRAHPPEQEENFVDQRDSFLHLYISLFPFLIGEYYAEKTFETLPSGIFFPIGFLIFWAFYYTYYKPGHLEKKLSNSNEWDIASIPTLLAGLLIWFVKVTFVGLAQVLILRWVVEQPKPDRRKARPINLNQQRAKRQRAESARRSPLQPTISPLPARLQRALSVLGMDRNCRNWNEIQRRYRHLAKQFHPDLNPEFTDVGRHFMTIDTAYRELCTAKKKFFPEKKRSA